MRWRGDRPPIVFDGEMRQSCKTLFTFTRPYFGTASSRSKTLAEWTYSGGSSSRSWMLDLPGLQIALERRALRADLVRALERLHALDEGTLWGSRGGLAGVFVAGGMGGESTALGAADKTLGREFTLTCS